MKFFKKCIFSYFTGIRPYKISSTGKLYVLPQHMIISFCPKVLKNTTHCFRLALSRSIFKLPLSNALTDLPRVWVYFLIVYPSCLLTLSANSYGQIYLCLTSNKTIWVGSMPIRFVLMIIFFSLLLVCLFFKECRYYWHTQTCKIANWSSLYSKILAYFHGYMPTWKK